MCTVAVTAAIVAVYAPAATNKAALAAGAAMTFLFMAFYGLAGDVCVFVIISEIYPNHLRAKGSTVAMGANTLTNLVYLQVSPTALANIGWKYFLVSLIPMPCPLLSSSHKLISFSLGFRLCHFLWSRLDLLYRSRDQGNRFGRIGRTLWRSCCCPCRGHCHRRPRGSPQRTIYARGGESASPPPGESGQRLSATIMWDDTTDSGGRIFVDTTTCYTSSKIASHERVIGRERCQKSRCFVIQRIISRVKTLFSSGTVPGEARKR